MTPPAEAQARVSYTWSMHTFHLKSIFNEITAVFLPVIREKYIGIKRAGILDLPFAEDLDAI